MNSSKTKSLRTFARQIATQIKPEEMEKVSGGFEEGSQGPVFCFTGAGGQSFCQDISTFETCSDDNLDGLGGGL